jgi:hypothetical protein
MSNTSPVAAPVATVTIQTPAGPVTSSSSQSSHERFAALAKAYGASVDQPVNPVVPSNLHWDSNNGRFHETALVTTPAAPVVAAPDPAAKVATFDSEMAAKGLQHAEPAAKAGIQQDRPSVPADQIDQAALKKLHEIYRSLGDEERARIQKTYFADLASVYAGRKLNESMEQFNARLSGQPAPVDAKQQAYNDALSRAVAAQDADGGLEHTAIDPLLTSGYQLVPGRYLALKDLLDGLRVARNRGFSQAKVAGILKDSLT